jgi:hypothetical protein
MGDVFRGSLELVDTRSIPLSKMQQAIRLLRESCSQPMRFFIFVQLHTYLLLEAIENIATPNVTFVTGSEDSAKDDLRLASTCDILLVLGASWQCLIRVHYFCCMVMTLSLMVSIHGSSKWSRSKRGTAALREGTVYTMSFFAAVGVRFSGPPQHIDVTNM